MGFLVSPFLDLTPGPLDLGRLAVGRSDLTGACEAESVCDGVYVNCGVNAMVTIITIIINM